MESQEPRALVSLALNQLMRTCYLIQRHNFRNVESLPSVQKALANIGPSIIYHQMIFDTHEHSSPA